MKRPKISKRARRLISGSTVTIATVGLTTCQNENNGGGVIDPAPPPPLTCNEGNQGQNLYGYGSFPGPTMANIEIYLFDPEHSHARVDTLSVEDVTGASFDSLLVTGSYYRFQAHLFFTLDSLSVQEVKFTLKGTWNLDKGPCSFLRIFTCKINQNGTIDVTQRERRLPLDVPRDVHIELVDRNGLRVNLRAAVAGEGTPEWRATAGKLERVGRLGIMWELPADPGYYQIELSVDRGVHGIGFDALALEVS